MIKTLGCPSCGGITKVDLNKTEYICEHCLYRGKIDESWKGMKKLRYSGRPK